MVQEQYVRFDTAKLLKGKGFDEECWHWYEDEDSLVSSNDDYGMQTNSDHIGDEFICSAPTQQLVMRWLREEHGVCIEIAVRHNDGLNGLPLFEYQWVIYHGLFREKDKGHFFEYYEDCLEAAIKYCLENILNDA